MINKLLSNYRIKNSIAIGFVLLVLFSSLCNSYINYQANKDILYQDIHKELKSAALNTQLLLGEEFFDKALHKDSISKQEDMKNILKLSAFAKNLDIEYIYTMVQRDGKIYFTSSSAKDDEINTSDMTRYFDIYDEATPLLTNVLQNNKIVYEESTDKWGTFKTIFIPKVTQQGNKYILGADIKVDFIKQKLNQFITDIIITQTIIILILIILGFYFIKISRKELYEIKILKEQLDLEIEMKTQELEDLNDMLEKKVQEELEKNRKKDQQLFHQSRLAQMGEMISMIAHQWRQPLTAIGSTSNSIMLKATLNTLDSEVAIKLSSKISDYTKHLSSTIDDFRNFFKANKSKKDTTYNELINSVLNIIEVSLKNKNIKLIKELNSTSIFHTYPNELKQVLLNLIKNAEDVLIDNNIKNPYIIIKTNKNILIIQDNGGGIPDEFIEKIFDPYFSTKAKNETGLGLYMSKIIIHDHCSGKLTVKNSKDGAIFTIELEDKKDD